MLPVGKRLCSHYSTLGKDPQLWPQLASKLILQLKNHHLECQSLFKVDWSLLITQRDIKSITNQQIYVCRIPFEQFQLSTSDLFNWCSYVMNKTNKCRFSPVCRKNMWPECVLTSRHFVDQGRSWQSSCVCGAWRCIESSWAPDDSDSPDTCKH